MRSTCVCESVHQRERKGDSVMQLMFLTRGQGSAHGGAAKVDKRTHMNSLRWRTRRNPHDQSGRPGDTQSVGDEEMDILGVGAEGERHRG